MYLVVKYYLMLTNAKQKTQKAVFLSLAFLQILHFGFVEQYSPKQKCVKSGVQINCHANKDTLNLKERKKDLQESQRRIWQWMRCTCSSSTMCLGISTGCGEGGQGCTEGLMQHLDRFTLCMEHFANRVYIIKSLVQSVHEYKRFFVKVLRIFWLLNTL